jgi:hypothetical protein
MVPAICVALVVPAWLHEAETHRVVYIVICGTASLTMLVRGRRGAARPGGGGPAEAEGAAGCGRPAEGLRAPASGQRRGRAGG